MYEPTPWLTIEMQGGAFLPKIDVQKMALALFHSAKDVATGKWTGLASYAEEAFKALGLQPTPIHLAGFLLQRAMTRAFQQIVEENRYRDGVELPVEKQTLEFFSREYGGRILTPLNKEFFQRPHQLPFVGEAAEPFRKWLIAFKVPEEEAKRLAETRFPLLLLYSLSDEWRKNLDFYKPILAASDTPFQAAAEREYDWTQYRFGLQTQFSAEPLFDEDFALERVYVPLRAYSEERVETERTAYARDAKHIRHVGDLETFILSWLQQRSPLKREKKSNPFKKGDPSRTALSSKPNLHETLCVLSGGPGSGKSSFCKKLAARLAEKGRQVLLIPMHQFTLKGDVPTSIGSFLERTRSMAHNPLQTKGLLQTSGTVSRRSPLVLIFDGLDELASQGRASEEAAQTFLIALKEYLRDENSGDLRVQAVLSGREVVIQTHQNEMTGRTVFHLLPYFLPQEEIEPSNSARSYSYHDLQNLLKDDQREVWWGRYTQVKEGKTKPMPEPLKRDDLQDITEQPLLNYLLALSYRRGEIDFAAETNRNAIYADLLRAVYEKRWGGENTHAAGLEFEDFAAVLEEIGLAVWHGNGRTAKLPDIQERCRSLSPGVLEKFAEGAEKGVTRLLTAFYFRKTEAHDAPAFEFTHKSFGEYLTARRLVSSLYDIDGMFTARRGRLPENVEERALIEWARVFGPTPLDPALLQFLRGEIALIHRSGDEQNGAGKRDVEAFQTRLCRLIETMLRNGMPMHHSDLKLFSYAEMDRQARNAEEALLAMLNACARVTEKRSDIAWSDRDEQGRWTQPGRAGTWLRRLCGHRMLWTKYSPLAWNCLGRLNFAYCHLMYLDLDEADLSGAELSRTELRGVDLSWADLSGADLKKAFLLEADLDEANLSGADLREAYFSEADFIRPAVSGAESSGANLIGVRNLMSSRNFDEAILGPEHASLLKQWKQANASNP